VNIVLFLVTRSSKISPHLHNFLLMVQRYRFRALAAGVDGYFRVQVDSI
jgi:hypothetical protein